MLNALSATPLAFARQGWEVICEYVDVVSGSGKKDRAQFQAMMLGASQRQFDLLLFWILDRLSREGIVKNAGLPSTVQGLECGLAWLYAAVLGHGQLNGDGYRPQRARSRGAAGTINNIRAHAGWAPACKAGGQVTG